MANLNALLELPGVVSAGEFSNDGQLIDLVGEMTVKAGKVAALMASANMASGKMQTAGWTSHTGKDGFEPAIGFAVSGPKKSALIVKNVGVFVNNDKADFDQLFKALNEL